ncbi:DgyrCDS13299 [Dimorphilus gyrociliatus]|uniref:DgyrCDS13299 n=1 Tax=Dimorphilus gyrociliatus TaxID=2664684 RepID=A0A7I8WAD4_9ANNE|nr:DgyrCDS13299 [Dimorphilus gyrociliatus]
MLVYLAALFVLVGSSWAQSNCTCTAFVDPNGLPPEYIDVNQFGVVGNTECGDRGLIDCAKWCKDKFVPWFDNLDLQAPRPNDSQNRIWGKYMCDQIRAGLGQDYDAVTITEYDASMRLDSCGGQWEDVITKDGSNGKKLCCDQIGNLVNCN